ncbi:threonine/serine exporter family protein [Bacillaceae bacterium Marseille-Q3522]|nr:threonine/serine exporter family protein [Bacillaceae bacterium Marseille-Q3522]
MERQESRMSIIAQLVTSFISTAAIAVIFNSPVRSLIKCGLVGMIGWVFYLITLKITEDTVVASLAASVVVGIVSQTCARIYKTPIIIFNVAGIIPLVPGGLAYNAMRHFVEEDYDHAAQFAGEALMISGSIALGLLITEVLNQLIKKVL